MIGTVGRLSEIKRQDVLIKAFALLKVDHLDPRLIIVGDGPQRQALSELVGKLGISSRVYFVGFQASCEKYLSAMDIFALTSDSEGTPLALLEAWAVGLPVVVTAVGGLPELVTENVTGKLVSRGDADAISNVLMELATDRSLRQRLSVHGQQFARSRFDRRTMAMEYDNLYRDLLQLS